MSPDIEPRTLTPYPVATPFVPEADTEAKKVLDKVKKIIALTHSSNESEAQAAMSAAAKLMARHNLKALEEKRVERPFLFSIIPLGINRIDFRLSRIYQILSDNYFVKIIIGQTYNPILNREEKVLHLVGRLENLSFAEHIFHFLMERSEAMWKNYHKTHKGGGAIVRNSYINGVLEGFQSKLLEVSKSVDNQEFSGGHGFAELILAKDQNLNDYYNELYPKTRNTAVRNSIKLFKASMDDGIMAGKTLNINLTPGGRAEQGRRNISY